MRVLFVCRGVEQFGIEILSAVLKQHGHTVGLLFDPGFDNFYFFKLGAVGDALARRTQQRLLLRARAFAPAVVAFSGFSNHYPYLTEFASRLRKLVPAFYIAGGIHARISPEQLLTSDSPFDAVAISEGEQTFPELLSRLAEQRGHLTTPGFYFRTPAGVQRNAPAPAIVDLNTLPLPDKDIFYQAGAFHRRLAFSSARGCPFACSFCQTPHLHALDGIKLRRLTPENTLSQLQLYAGRYRSTGVTFQDDDFTYDHNWLREFLPRYRQKIGLPFQCNTHPLSMNGEIARLLAACGCRSVCMGIQSGSEQLRRDLLNRRDRNCDIRAAASAIQRQGISLVAEFIFGFPGETEADIAASVELAFALAPENLPTFTYYPFYGSALFARLLAGGVIDEWLAGQLRSGAASYQENSLFPATTFPAASRTANCLLPAANQLHRLGFIKSARRLLTLTPQPWMPLIRLLSLPWFNTWQFSERLANLWHCLPVVNRCVVFCRKDQVS